MHQEVRLGNKLEAISLTIHYQWLSLGEDVSKAVESFHVQIIFLLFLCY